MLINRLEELLVEAAHHRERIADIRAAWDRWYKEMVRHTAEHGIPADPGQYHSVSSEGLPDASELNSHLDSLRDPLNPKVGIVTALCQIGDQRAAPVIAASLADDDCVLDAAMALRDIRYKKAVDPLLDALTRTTPFGDPAKGEIVKALCSYDVPAAKVEERLSAEASPQARKNLMELLAKLADEGDGATPTFLQAVDDSKGEVRWAAIEGLKNSWRGSDSEAIEALTFLALDEEESVSWRAALALHEIEQGPEVATELSRYELPQDIICSAIIMAARGEVDERNRELTYRLRQVARTPVGAQAIHTVIGRMPQPPAEELQLALELFSRTNTGPDDPMDLVRALHRLSSFQATLNWRRTRRQRADQREGSRVSASARRRGAGVDELDTEFGAVAAAVGVGEPGEFGAG